MKTIDERIKDMANGGFQPAVPPAPMRRITRHVTGIVESSVHPVSTGTMTVPPAAPAPVPAATSYELLLSCELPPEEARKWAARRSHEYIVRLARYSKRHAKSNLAGYVWRALKEDWSIPC